jgi:phosphoglycolate phosphatase
MESWRHFIKLKAEHMNRSGLLIFDLDGTLFRSETATIPAVRKSFEEFGLPIPPDEEVFKFIGRPHADFQKWIKQQCQNDRAAALVAMVDSLELAFVTQTGELYPHVKDVLIELASADFHMAICTNGERRYVERVLASQQIGSFFDAIRMRLSSTDSKPSMVQDLLRQFSNRRAIVVGDRYDDIEAAHENGIAAVAANYGYGSSDELASADATAHSPAELPKLVRSLISDQIGE